MTTNQDIHGAHGEWDYREVESGVMDGVTFDTAIPCQLRFTEDVQQNTRLFHQRLDERGFSPVNDRADRKAEPGKPHYDGEVVCREHYSRVRILVFRGGVVRLYPHDDRVPSAKELGLLVEALEEGFGAPLEHDPIETEMT